DGDRDGLPNVLMEAASQTLPIISTAVAAIPEFIETGVHGILTSDAPADISDAIMTLVQSPQMAADMADAAYTRLVDEFDMDPGIAQLSRRLTALGV
ncbi:MAG: glycosyltransferase, partial [Paracoccaceae bacterium]